jgi:hypothetical protein
MGERVAGDPAQHREEGRVLSVIDIDRAGAVRMCDYMTADRLNTNGIVALASAILTLAEADLSVCAQQTAAYPSAGNFEHLRALKAFYMSDMFTILCAGIIDGESAMREIIRRALHGRKVNAPREAEGMQV